MLTMLGRTACRPNHGPRASSAFRHCQKKHQSDVLLLQVPLFAKIVKAWQATASRRKGLFNRSFDAELFRNSTDSEHDFGPLADTVAAHHLWLKYLDEAWKVAFVLHDLRLLQVAVISNLQHDVLSAHACLWRSLGYAPMRCNSSRQSTVITALNSSCMHVQAVVSSADGCRSRIYQGHQLGHFGLAKRFDTRCVGVQVAMEELTTAGPQILKMFNIILAVALSSPLTQHPCAVGPTFYLLRLALRHAGVVAGQKRRQHPVCNQTPKLPSSRPTSVLREQPLTQPLCAPAAAYFCMQTSLAARTEGAPGISLHALTQNCGGPKLPEMHAGRELC